MKKQAILAMAVMVAAGSITLGLAQGRGTGRPESTGQGHKPSFAQLLSIFDYNHDGKISSEEVPPRLWSRLSAADENGDGAVD